MRIIQRLFAPADVRQLQAELDRLADATERAKSDARKSGIELAEAVATAARLRQELDEAKADLRVAKFENTQLWSLNNRNQSRIERESAVELRARAEAETARLDSLTTASRDEDEFGD